MKHLDDVYSEQLRISLKSEITSIYKRQIEEIQRLKLTPSVSLCACVRVCQVKRTIWILKVGLLNSFLFSSLQWVCDPESGSRETFWLHEEAERREPGLDLDPFCDPSTAWTWWASCICPPALMSLFLLSAQTETAAQGDCRDNNSQNLCWFESDLWGRETSSGFHSN